MDVPEVPPIARGSFPTGGNGRAPPAPPPRLDVSVDMVALTPEARAYAAYRELVRRALEGLERRFDDARERFEPAGREGFERFFDDAELGTPAAAAGTILRGVTGYLYAAFRAGRAPPRPDDVEEFRAGAEEAIRAGVEAARASLAADGLLPDDAETRFDTVLRVALLGLDGFAAGERGGLREAAAEEDDDAAARAPAPDTRNAEDARDADLLQ